jgi:hypothetical protein
VTNRAKFVKMKWSTGRRKVMLSAVFAIVLISAGLILKSGYPIASDFLFFAGLMPLTLILVLVKRFTANEPERVF